MEIAMLSKKWTLLFSIVFVIINICGNASLASAGAINAFEAPFDAVLDNLMTNYWPADESGDWLYDDWAPCGGYDAPQYATELLYNLAIETGDPTYQFRADRTVEHVIEIANLPTLFGKILNGEDLTEEVTGLPAFIYGQAYYSGPSQFSFDTTLLLLSALADELLVSQGQSIPYINGYSGPATLAYYYLLISYNFMDRGDTAKAARLARRAYALFPSMEDYWIQVNEDKGYYSDPDDEDGLWDWGVTLQALALAYQASGSAIYLDRAGDLLGYLEDCRDEAYPFGYFSSPTSTLKQLSHNHLITRALLILYDATTDPAWFERAYETITFMTNDEVLIDDERFPGDSIIGHDWDVVHGTNPCACSGCNFAVLASIHMYNALEQEGPSGIDPLPTCMITMCAIGSPLEERLGALRSLRDGCLASGKSGRFLVETYYALSPSVEPWMSGSRVVRGLTRGILAALVAIGSVIM